MERIEVENQLNNIIINNSPEDLKLSDFHGKSIIDDLEFDSVSLMQLVTDIEEIFGVSMDESDSLLELLDSYDELVDYLAEKKGVCHE